MSKGEEGGNLDGSILPFEVSKLDGLELEEETESKEEGNTSQSEKGDTVEEGIVVIINDETVLDFCAPNDGVCHVKDTISQVVQGISNIDDKERNDGIVIILEPAVVELFFEGGVVELGGSNKTLEVHL